MFWNCFRNLWKSLGIFLECSELLGILWKVPNSFIMEIKWSRDVMEKNAFLGELPILFEKYMETIFITILIIPL